MSCNSIYNDESIPLMGVVFCGGQSSRMGTDKGLIVKQNEKWVELAVGKFQQIGLDTCLSLNNRQVKAYESLHLPSSLVTDVFSIEGPLCGLLSVHNAFPSHDLVILACDMLDVEVELINRLIQIYQQKEGEHDFFVFKNGHEIEPFLGIYTREGLQKVFDVYALGQLLKKSMKHVLEIGNTCFVELLDSEKSQMNNYNYPEQLKGG